MPAGPEQRLNPEERANLVAFIDGELTDEESRALATKLSHSPTARREVESLKQTWELLENLPRPRASSNLSERTLTSIQAVESKGEEIRQTARVWVGRLARTVASMLIALTALAVGFGLTRWLWPDPAARLIRDLSLAEHLDEYQEVGSFNFLDELAQSREFGRPSH
jgi:anti-sigma factor RsiW